MERIKITDYVSEYEFRRATGPKYQTSSLRPVIQERKKKPDNDDRVLMKRPTCCCGIEDSPRRRRPAARWRI